MYTTRRIGRTPFNYTGINLIFDRTVDVTQAAFRINAKTFLTRLGGAVASGRTLLWILVSLLGATQVKNYPFNDSIS